MVYVEQLGKVELPRMREAGVSMSALLRHYQYITEFIWQHVEPSESGRTFSLLDMRGIGMRDLAGEVFEFVRAASSFVQEHYPERSFHVRACVRALPVLARRRAHLLD